MWHTPSTIFSRRHALRIAGLIALCVAITTTLFFSASLHAAPGINQTLSFSGRLMNSAGGIVADGHYNIQFKIYQDGAGTAAGNPGGTLKWTETYINNGGTNGVEVKNGYFSVNLGSSNPFGSSVDWNQDTLWLSMNVAGSSTSCTTYGTAPCTADGEMLPMKRMTSVPFAMNAGRVGGLTAAQLIQNTTSVQSGANIAIQSAGDASITAFIQGRTNQSSTTLLIQQGSAQTGKAIDIQGSNGASIFNIDQDGDMNHAGDAHIGGSLALGTTNSPERPLDIAVNDSSINTLPVRITQQGSGDVGIEMSATGTSKYSVGIDATDGAFKISNSTGGGATTTFGDTNINSNDITSTYQRVLANKYTAAQSGTIQSMSVYTSAVDTSCPNIQLGVYADNGSGTAPGTLIGASSLTPASVGWNTVSMTSTINISNGTTYWLGVYTACAHYLKYHPSIGTRASKDGVSPSLPNSFTPDFVLVGQVSLYATIDTGGSGSVDSFASDGTLFSLGPDGNATFKTSEDSDSAFQVQNSAGSDVLSVNTDDAAGAPNIQIGDGSDSGTPTLLTVDKASSAPTVTDENALLGSMYYDTTLGKVQCYEDDGWGACGAPPDNFVTISPEYTNAVMNGNDVGTITSDLCSDALNVNDGSSGQPTVCGTNETYNFYKWTSGEASGQTRSIYVTYQLPSTFKQFVAGSTSLMGRTDGANSSVTYQVYKDHAGSALASCGSAVSVSTGSQTTWQEGTATGSADPSTCGFAAGDSILVRINLTSHGNANAYVSTLGFTFSNN